MGLNVCFDEITYDEAVQLNGGLFGPTLFVIWGIKVTVGHCMVAGAAVGLSVDGALVIK